MFIKLAFLLPLVVLSSALVIPINKVAAPAPYQSDALGEKRVGDVEDCDSDGAVVEVDVDILESDCGDEGVVLVDLDLVISLSNICRKLSSLLGGILKKGHPIDSAMLQARSGGSGDELVDLDLTVLNELVDLDLLVNLNLSGVNGLLINISCLLNGLLGSILKKGHPIDPAMMLARSGGSGGSLIDVAPKVDLSSLLANIVCLLSSLLGNILKTHPINQDVLVRGTLLGGADTRSDFEGNVPPVDLSLLLNLEALLHSAISAGGENALHNVDLEAILNQIHAIILSNNTKGHPVNLAAAELGRKLFKGISEKNEAMADGSPQSAGKLVRSHNVRNGAAANLRLTKH